MKNDKSKPGFATRAIHAGQSPDPTTGAVMTPIFATSTFKQHSPGVHTGYEYARSQNPTRHAFERCIADLEGGTRGFAFASGLAASSTVLELLDAGSHIVAADDLYGGSWRLFERVRKRSMGLKTSYADPNVAGSLEKAIQPDTKMIWLETPSNPLSEIGDIAALAKIAKQAGAWLAVDNCLLTPALQRPCEFGADLVIHSATKYIDGQGRVLAGAVCGRKELIEQVYSFVRTAGPAISPFNAWVCLKGLETLKLRVEAQSHSTLALAHWLEAHASVERVYYAGLMSHPQHALAMRQSALQGAVLSFEVKGGRAEAWRVVDAVKMISITANLGDTKTTITHPATTTHARISQAERDRAGIKENLLRVAVGLESVEDLTRDLSRGL